MPYELPCGDKAGALMDETSVDVWNVIRKWPLRRVTFLTPDGANGKRLLQLIGSFRKMYLTARERKVVALIGLGCTNLEISQEIHVSVRTVKSHVSRLLRKFGVDNRVQLAAQLSFMKSEPSECPRISQLTPREQQMAGLVARGKTNWQIAIEMGTTEQVVKNYLRVVFDKMGVWSRLELACRVLNRGVSEPNLQAVPESMSHELAHLSHHDFVPRAANDLR